MCGFLMSTKRKRVFCTLLIFLVVSSILSILLMNSRVFHIDSRQPQIDAEEINVIFLKLEYMRYLVKDYMKHTGRIPDINLDFPASVKFLKNTDVELEEQYIAADFRQFLELMGKTPDLFLSILTERALFYSVTSSRDESYIARRFLVNRMNDNKFLPYIEKTSKKSFYHFGRISRFFTSRDEKDPGLMCIGVESNLLCRTDNIRYINILISMRPSNYHLEIMDNKQAVEGILSTTIPTSINFRHAKSDDYQ